MDSMINHYTANRKVRNQDAYSPGGRIGLRPDRATLAYCQRAREAYKGVPVIAGGVEASLRRLAHYDYWSDKVRRSILLDCKADLLVYGMGEDAIVEIARRLDAGQTVRSLRDMRGVAYALGASESPPDDALCFPASNRWSGQVAVRRSDADDSQRDQSRTTRGDWCSGTTARRWWSIRRRCPSRRRRWTGSTGCRTPASRIPVTPNRFRPLR
jgi:uncharacterized radical SAM protein YgiQ